MIEPDIIAYFETRRRLKILKRVARFELAWKITISILVCVFPVSHIAMGSVCIFRNYKSVNLGQSDSLQYCHRALYLYAFWTQTMGYVIYVIGFTIVKVCNLIKNKILAKIPMKTTITEKDNVGTTTTTIWHTGSFVGNNVMIKLPWWVGGLVPPDLYETHSVESDDKVSDTHMDVQEGESFGRSDTPSIDLDDKLSNTQMDSPEGETLRRSDTPSRGSDDKLSNTQMDEAKGEQSGQSEPPRVNLDDKLSDTNMGEADDETHSADLKERMADIQIDGQEGEQSEPVKTEYAEKTDRDIGKCPN